MTKLKLVGNDIQIIGLSAVIGNSRILPEWLEADLLLEHRRPVELRMGYLSEGIYHYQTFNNGEQGMEEFIPGLTGGDKREIMVAVAGYLARSGEQSLVFLPDKDSTRRLAMRLYDETDLSPAQKAMEELKLLEETNSRDALVEVLEGGIAFHNADLSAEERSIVEKYFRQGEIRILTSTTTLAMGVNLPAKNVLLDLQLWQAPAGSRNYSLNLMSKSDFENIDGRAGRFGMEAEFGRAIAIATSLKDQDVFRHKYLEGDIEHIKPQLWEGSMATAVMNSVALGNCATLEEIKVFLRNSLTWKIYSSEPDYDDNQESKLDKGIRDCQYAGVIKDVDGSRMELTPLGKAAARMGITVETASVINKWLEARGDSAGINELEIFLLSSITDDGLDAYLNLSTSAYHSQCDTWLYRISDDIGKDVILLIKNLVNQRVVNEYLLTKCIRNSYAYKDYIGILSNRELEQKYALYLGSIRNAAEQISWVVRSIAETAKELGYAKELIERIGLWAERLQYGVAAAGISLARLRVPGLGRERIRALVHQGFDTIEAIKELSIEALARWITKPVAERLARAVLSQKLPIPQPEEVAEYSEIDNSKTPKDRLVIIGKMERNRTLIKLNGHIIRLREKNFELLLRFVLARLNGDEGWIHKMDLELPENGITQGISRLRDSLSVLQLDSASSIIENNSNNHYRLALPPEQIEIDRDTIKRHWSTIIQELVS